MVSLSQPISHTDLLLTEPDHTADDLSNSLKNGLLYMQDPINKVSE